jgi:hypothetical protein
VARPQTPLIPGIFILQSHSTFYFFDRENTSRKHELHYLLPPRSSSPLHRSVQAATASSLPDKSDVSGPSRVRSVAVEASTRLSTGIRKKKITYFLREACRRRCSARAACSPAAAWGPGASGRRGPMLNGCVHWRPHAGGASRPPPRRRAPLLTCRRRLLPRRSGLGMTRRPHHQGNLAFLVCSC